MGRVTVQGSEYLMWGDKLVQIVGISEGKVIHMRGLEPCEHCGKLTKVEYSYLEDSPYFQEMAKPVKTINSHPEKDQG